jgi:RHS repeat-associated protein
LITEPDTYDYDAFGNKVNSTGTTPNNYLYRGEQYDPDLGLYYLRARYYNPMTGRFVSMDPENGIVTDPRTLHKYLYANGDPINRIDPTGRAGTGVAIGGGDLGEYAGILIAITGLFQATKTVAQHPDTVIAALHDLSDGVNCVLEYTACALTSLADKPGSVWGESRCRSCYLSCVGSGKWPGSIPSTSGGRMSCNYSK